MASVKIIGSPTSTDMARVLACLFEKDVHFQLVRVDAFHVKEHHFEKLMIQPTRHGATFEHGDITLTDSRDIIRYVAKNFPKKDELLGPGMLERASIEYWLKMEENLFEPASSNLLNLAFPVSMPSPHAKDELYHLKKDLADLLDLYEKQLWETKYLAGDKFSLADLSHLPNTQKLMTTECASLFNSRKRVSQWWKEISSRPSWKRVMDMQAKSPEVA